MEKTREGDWAMNPLAITIRTKKLGVLIRDARLSAHKSVKECAEAINVNQADFEAYELGEKAPSLPEVELLAYYLEIPLDHFWGNTALSEKSIADNNLNGKQLIEIRQKLIGVTLRQAREQAQLSLQDVTDGTGLAPEELEAVEFGQRPISLPMLEYLSSYFNLLISEFQDKHGPVGTKTDQQRTIHDFLTLPPDIQAFVAKPINRPYLELAQRLSEMSVEKLRAVGEGILEITL